MKSLSYAVLGTGAVGGLYGARLIEAGVKVHFLARGDFDALQSNGLQVDSAWGNTIHYPISVSRAGGLIDPVDVLLVCLKTTSNSELPSLIRPLVAEGTVIVLMQNGLGAEEEVAKFFPKATLGGGLCFLCSNRMSPGKIHHVDYGRVLFGILDGSKKERMERIAADFSAGSVPVELTEDLAISRWKKLMWNIPFNGLTAAEEKDTSEIMQDEKLRAESLALVEETRLAAAACGHQIPESFRDWIVDFTKNMKPYKTSMQLDREAGREMEIEFIYDRPAAAARQAGFKMERTEMLALRLRSLSGA